MSLNQPWTGKRKNWMLNTDFIADCLVGGFWVVVVFLTLVGSVGAIWILLDCIHSVVLS